MKPIEVVFSTDFETSEPTWKDREYTPMATLVFGKDKPATKDNDNE